MSSNNQECHHPNETEQPDDPIIDEQIQGPSIVTSNGDELNREQASEEEEEEENDREQVTTSVVDPVREYMLQKHLALLIHAQTCLNDETERNIPAANCRIPFCDVMRNILKHLDICQNGGNCTEELCSSSRLLLHHLKNCGQRTCFLCLPFVDVDVLLSSSPEPSEGSAQNSPNEESNGDPLEDDVFDRRRFNRLANVDVNHEEAASSMNEILHSPTGISKWIDNTRKMIQLNWQLFVLLHADKCRAHKSLLSCPTPNCLEFKAALQHMPGCQQGKNCTFPHCSACRQIINHWTKCQVYICPLCEPIRQLEGVRNRNFFSSVLPSQRAQRNPGPSNPPPPLRPISLNQPGLSGVANNLNSAAQSNERQGMRNGHCQCCSKQNQIRSQPDVSNGINSTENNPPVVRERVSGQIPNQSSSDISSYRTPLGIGINIGPSGISANYNAPNIENHNARTSPARSVNNPLPPLRPIIHISHGPSCNLSTSASGSFQLCPSAEYNYSQTGLRFSNSNPTTQTDVSPPGMRVGYLPGYEPDDISPPGVRVGSIAGYSPEPTMETDQDQRVRNNQGYLLRPATEYNQGSVNNSEPTGEGVSLLRIVTQANHGAVDPSVIVGGENSLVGRSEPSNENVNNGSFDGISNNLVDRSQNKKNHSESSDRPSGTHLLLFYLL